MPIQHRIYPEHELTYVNCAGHVDMKLSQQAMKAVARDPLHSPRFRVLVEVDGMEFEPTHAEARELGRSLGGVRDSYQGRVAIVASGALLFGLMRMVAVFAEMNGFTMKVFGDVARAHAWLGLPDDLHPSL